MTQCYQIDTGYACGGIVIENDKVIETAPIFKWMLGKSLSQIQGWKKIKSMTETVDNNIWVGDLESDGFLDVATTVWCGVFKNIESGEFKKFCPDDVYYLHHMMQFMDTVSTLVMHNGLQYDLPLLEKLYGYTYKGNKIDTLVWSRMLSPKRSVPYNCPVRNRPHSVETWGYRVGRGKPDHKDWTQYSKEMLHRCTEDVEIQHLIYNELLKEMHGHDWGAASWLNLRLFEILGKQEQQGWLVDKEWMNNIIHMTTRWIDRIDAVLSPRLPLVLEIQETKHRGEYNYVKKPFKKDGKYNEHMLKWHERSGVNPDERLIGGPFTRLLYRPLDPASRVEAIAYLLDNGWKPKDWNTNDSGERTSPKLSKDDPFDGVKGREGNLFAKRCQIRHRRSSVEGLLKLIRPDGRIASRVTNLAETGRVTHGGIVNIPNSESFMGRWMRKIFICPDDKVLVSVDSAGCQNRMLAARVGDPIYTDIMLKGKKADGTALHNINQKNLLEAGYDEHYNNCKNLNYAFMFGASDTKLGKMVKGDIEDGKRIREVLANVSTEFSKLIDNITQEWRSHAKKRSNRWGKINYYDGWIRGLDGRPIFIDSEHKLLVYLLQSDEAIMMGMAYVILYDWCEQKGWKWGEDWAYVCWYHDEYTAEVNPEIAEEFKYLGEQAITAAGIYYNIACPHIGEGSIGKSWAEVH